MVDKIFFGAVFFLIAIGCTYATIGEGIEGAWFIYWDWNCIEDAGGPAEIIFNSDGTFIATWEPEDYYSYTYTGIWANQMGELGLDYGSCGDTLNFNFDAYFVFEDYGTIYYFDVDGDTNRGCYRAAVIHAGRRRAPHWCTARRTGFHRWPAGHDRDGLGVS